ncbi:hypothetical protein AAY473_008636 [Plecturocebus cupreus]
MGFQPVDQADLEPLTSSDPHASASQSAGIPEAGSHSVVQDEVQWPLTGMIIVAYSLELLGSSNFPFSASPAARITGTCCHCAGSHHFGRPRRVDHLMSGVRDQPGQYGETPSLLKIQKLARCDVSR